MSHLVSELLVYFRWNLVMCEERQFFVFWVFPHTSQVWRTPSICFASMWNFINCLGPSFPHTLQTYCFPVFTIIAFIRLSSCSRFSLLFKATVPSKDFGNLFCTSTCLTKGFGKGYLGLWTGSCINLFWEDWKLGVCLISVSLDWSGPLRPFS